MATLKASWASALNTSVAAFGAATDTINVIGDLAATAKLYSSDFRESSRKELILAAAQKERQMILNVAAEEARYEKNLQQEFTPAEMQALEQRALELLQLIK